MGYIGVVVDDDVQELNPCCEVTENIKYRVKILDGWDSKTHKGDKPAEFVYPNPLNYPAGMTMEGSIDDYELGQLEYRGFDIVKHEDITLLERVPESFITKNHIDQVVDQSDRISFPKKVFTVEKSIDGMDFINTLQYIGEIKYSDEVQHCWNLSVRILLKKSDFEAENEKTENFTKTSLVLKQFNFKRRIDILGSDSKIVTTVEASQPINDTRLRPGDSPFFQRNIQIKTN